MLKLLTYKPGFDQPSLSPFCIKAMILLDLAGVEWEPEWTAIPPKESYGKLPALRTPDGLIADSNFILDWLGTQGVDLFPGLDSPQKAQAHAVIRMTEENLRLGIIHARWVCDEGWEQLKPVGFGDLPAVLRLIVPGIIRKDIVKFLKKQGMAQYSDMDRSRSVGADLQALTTLLGNNPWFFGEQPTAVDATVLPVLSILNSLPNDGPLRRLMREQETLMAYVARGRAELYPKWFNPVSAESG